MNNISLPREQIVVINDLAHRTGMSRDHIAQMLVEIGMLTMIMSKKDAENVGALLLQIKSKQTQTPELNTIATVLSQLFDKTSKKV